MAWVETRITRTTQPQDACAIDWNNALTRQLAFAWSAADPRREASKGIPADTNNTTKIASVKGIAAKSSLGQTNLEWNREFISTSNGVGTGDFTIVLLADPSAGGGASQHLFAQKNDAAGSPFNQAVFAANSNNSGYLSGSMYFGLYSATSGSLGSVSSAGALDGKFHVWAGRRVGRANTLWKDGAQLAGGTEPTAIPISGSPARRTAIGSRGNGTTEGYDRHATFAVAFNRALSDAEIKSLSENPWQIFEPEVTRLWIDDTVSAGGAATVIPIGVQATGSVGTPSATGAATATPAGVSTSSAVGTPVAVGGASIPATALPAGVQATAAVGTVSATGAAVAQPVGVAASSAVGTPVAIGESAGVTVVYPAGVQAVSAVGTPSVTAAARVIPIGVQAMGEVGEPLAYAGDTPPVVATSNYGFEMSAGKRYYIKRKGKILLFDSAEQADDYLAVEQQATVVTSRGAKKRIAAKLVKVAPLETIELEPVTELLSRYMPEVSLPNLLKMRDIEQVIAMQHQALQMQDDEDIELLLMTL